MFVIKNKIQAVLISISVILFSVQYLCLCILSLPLNKIFLFIFPLFLICLFIIIENLIKIKKHFIQCISIFLCIFVILFLQIGLGTVLMIGSYSAKNIIKNDVTDIYQYSNIIKTMHSKQVKHFPQNIPKNVQNIGFYCSKDSYFGGKVIFIKFDADDKYIKLKLNKYKYILLSDGKTLSIARGFVLNELVKQHFVTNINDYQFYVIGDNSNTRNCHHSCEYGIAVNEKTNTIIYYASNPD